MTNDKKLLVDALASAIPSLDILRQFHESQKAIENAFPGKRFADVLHTATVNARLADQMREAMLDATTINRPWVYSRYVRVLAPEPPTADR